MANPRFTFCIPNLNKIDFLPACIESMLAQDCDDWCCVFVDGFSTDGCWEYMQQFVGDPRFRLMRGLKQGMYADWNECLRHVKTEYFYILTSDDTCYPDLVSTTAKALDAVPDIDVCHFKFALIDSEGQTIRTSPETAKLQFPLYYPFYERTHRRQGLVDFLAHFVYGALYTTITSLVFRSRILSKMYGFSVMHGSIGDYDWTMRLGLHSDILYIPNLLSTWRKYDGQADSLTDDFSRRKNKFDIGRRNLAVLEANPSFQQLMYSEVVVSKAILKDLQDSYVSTLYRSLFARSSLPVSQRLRLLAEAINYDIWYIIRKMLRRISSNRLFPYDPNALLLRIFENVVPDWQPSFPETKLVVR
jgi:glycosyltransferase involved in cell wall biosynthesis